MCIKMMKPIEFMFLVPFNEHYRLYCYFYLYYIKMHVDFSVELFQMVMVAI